MRRRCCASRSARRRAGHLVLHCPRPGGAEPVARSRDRVPLAVPRAEICIPSWSTAALILLEGGESERYRSFCSQALTVEELRSSRIAAVQAGWTCALAPGARADVAAALRSLDSFPNRLHASKETVHFVYATEGALLYRAGRYQEALDRLRSAIDADHDSNNPVDWVFQAMTYYRLGRVNEARRCLAQAFPRLMSGLARRSTGMTWKSMCSAVRLRQCSSSTRDSRRIRSPIEKPMPLQGTAGTELSHHC